MLTLELQQMDGLGSFQAECDRRCETTNSKCMLYLLRRIYARRKMRNRANLIGFFFCVHQ